MSIFRRERGENNLTWWEGEAFLLAVPAT